MRMPNKRAIRTAIQAAVSLAAFLPGLAAADGAAELWPWMVGAAAAAGAFARFMMLPAVENFLDLFGLGLADDPGGDDS